MHVWTTWQTVRKCRCCSRRSDRARKNSCQTVGGILLRREVDRPPRCRLTIVMPPAARKLRPATCCSCFTTRLPMSRRRVFSFICYFQRQRASPSSYISSGCHLIPVKSSPYVNSSGEDLGESTMDRVDSAGGSDRRRGLVLVWHQKT